MSNCKSLYRGVFSYHREAEILRLFAHSEAQARVFMCRRLANKHGVSPGVVLNLFDGSKDNFTIEKEIEYKEIDE